MPTPSAKPGPRGERKRTLPILSALNAHTVLVERICTRALVGATALEVKEAIDMLEREVESRTREIGLIN